MNIQEFLSYLRNLDVKLWVDSVTTSTPEARLRCNAPKGTLTPDLRAELTQRKAEIIQFLFEENRLKEVRNTIKESLINICFLCGDRNLPLVISPTIDKVNLVIWAEKNQDLIQNNLLNYGAILFRNFNVSGVEEFEQFIKVTSQGELLDYTYRSTPRTQVSGKIYTSTEYPADQSIPLHNENAYSCVWPMKIGFFCVETAEQGGETPIADSRKVFQSLDSTIKDQFIQKKVMYVRNYGELDLSWQNVFQTTNKLEVENYCRQSGIEFEWSSNHLRTRQVCQAVAKHPSTKEMVWFNQAHLFHVSSFKPEIREALLSFYKEDELPRNAYYGDGSPIESSVLDEIREIYQQETVTFSWQEGDILLLDNMLAAHGRMPFVGKRKIVVGMAEPSKF
ncbi:MAG: TauD/TfdA family dioxygenase [Nostoc sp.]